MSSFHALKRYVVCLERPSTGSQLRLVVQAADRESAASESLQQLGPLWQVMGVAPCM